MEETSVLVITSGGFDPLHDGHVEYLKKAKRLFRRTIHVCIVNNDNFLLKKKGYCVLSQQQRMKIIGELNCVDFVFRSDDEDESVKDSIEKVYHKYNGYFSKVVFAKGGDRYKNEIPESGICKQLGIAIVDGLGEKIESSSEMMKRVISN